MGFSSWLCKGCGQGVRNVYSGEAKWMYDAVMQKSDGTRLIGAYDGYGRIDDVEVAPRVGEDVEAWHRVCWDHAGKPDYSGPSESDPEQGHFGEAPKHPLIGSAPAS